LIFGKSAAKPAFAGLGGALRVAITVGDVTTIKAGFQVWEVY
jgi:hypothetical protein